METANRFSKFIPDRLIQAREARGVTLTELADIVEISHQAISKYENKKSVPSFDTLEKLSEALNVPVTFFYKEPPSKSESVVYFRSMAMATQKSKNVHQHKINWIREIHTYLEQYLDFPHITVPRVITRESYIPTDFQEIDNIASEVRKSWSLGNGPISDIILLLEKAGVIVAYSPSSSYKIDACSKWEPGERPYILLSNDKTAPRSRFDIAHELGHLVLHSRIKQSEFNKKVNYKLIEKEANRFAGAFLLPASSFGTEIVSTSLDHFVSLKKRWKVSIQAMAYRAHSLGILSEYQHINMRQKLAKNNQLTREPLDDDLPFEQPSVLKQAITALVDHKAKTKQDIVSELCFNRDEIEVLSNLDVNYLETREHSNVIQLNFKK
ncbi:Zn-dependent peptidase ImmA (M78 family)/DNA-binding XRE family transcriptional regulator [Paenibacillus shirakamiensis]|uniref:Zn-dependent peptidase ImmA (M78 family)/DNA-binding XRE family transcriptional regulator n=1 Tax=Paenibacillus shirakamiensis TaxID=1265935 RepID=A0ABS4JDM2_9BACL|nr:XRE family transcriptional regulator [Paenibacillus shirakamiensis]MBP1999770.1 Zn-dependent peptidase ImmA (M78 family)/DNA-binding XRE family transcriptional regulator [Paenibacillus shirakamiensis]